MANNKKRDKKVLVVAPSKNTRGGISAVINAYATLPLWNKWHCKWIETQIDKSLFHKAFYFAKSYIQFLFIFSGYDIIHIHFSEPISVIRKSLFFFTSKIFKKKVIVHFHSFSSETTINSKYKRIYKRIFSKADKILVLSQYWENEIINFVGKLNISILYNPCVIPQEYNTQVVKEKYILFAGTLNDRKGFKDLIKAFAKVHENMPMWYLVFAGNGDIDAGKILSATLGIENKVVFKGWVSGAEKDDVFRKATIFCLPSYAEGVPMAVLDAMSYSLPVITTPVGGINDFFEDGVDLSIFTPGDINVLAQKIEMLFTNDILRATFVANALLILRNKFEISIIGTKLDKIYSSLT